MCEDHQKPERIDENEVTGNRRADSQSRPSSISKKSSSQPGLASDLALDAIEVGTLSLSKAAASTALVTEVLTSGGTEETVSSSAQTSYEVIGAGAEDGVSFLESAGELASGLIDGAVEFVGSILSD